VDQPLDLLPDEVREALASDGPAAAGDRLRVHAEALARCHPGEARRWSDALLDAAPGPPGLRPWLHWSAATVRLLEGDLGGAEPLLRTAARSFAARHAGELADRVRLSLVDVYGERLEVARARRLAVTLERRFATRGDASRSAIAIANLACAEDAADRVDRAVGLWRRSLTGLTPGTDDRRRLLVEANLANAAYVAGRFDAAREGHRRVIERARGLGLEALELQAGANLAEVEFALGEVDAALRRWAHVAERALAIGHRLVALSANLELAAAELELGRPVVAEERLIAAEAEAAELGLVLERARAVRLRVVAEAALGRLDDERVAASLRSLAGRRFARQRDLLTIDLARLGGDLEARSLIAAARRLIAAGLTHRGLIGLAWAARRELDAGRTRRATRLAAEVLGARHTSPWARMTSHHVLARAAADAGTALRHAERAARDADRIHALLASAADRTAFLRSRGEVYLDLIRRLLARGRPRDRRRCLELVHTLKSGWLLDELGRWSDLGDDAAVRRWLALRKRLSSLLERAQGEDEPRLRYAGLGFLGELTRVERELARVESELQRARPMLAPVLPTWKAGRLLSNLPNGHVVAEYLMDGDDLVVLVARAGRLRAVRRAGVAHRLEALVGSIRFHLDAHPWAQRSGRPARRLSLEQRLAELGQVLLDPLAGEDWQVLWIAPHHTLYHVPWTGLLDPEGRSLIDRGVVTLVPGGASVDALLAQAPQPPRSAALVAAAGESLPLVAAELAALARELPGATRMAGATRGDFLDALARFDLVHLAGHAVFLDGLPGASGLRLGDGFVTVHDLAAAPVRARVVTFGVCSGLRLGSGDASPYEGFLRVLLGRGVRCLVGPLAWVEDGTAHDFGVAFHAALATSGDPGLAFRAAVTGLRERDPHPATWATFQLYGDVRSWRSR